MLEIIVHYFIKYQFQPLSGPLCHKHRLKKLLWPPKLLTQI